MMSFNSLSPTRREPGRRFPDEIYQAPQNWAKKGLSS